MNEDELLIEAFELEEETEYPEVQSLPQVSDLLEDISIDEDRETFIIDENENLISDENADTGNLIDGFPALLDPVSAPDPVIENNENNELLVEEIKEDKAEENIETRRIDNNTTVNDNSNSNTLPDQTVNYDLKVDIPSYKEDLNEIRDILYNIENETEENNVYSIDDLYYLIDSKELDNERINDIYYLLEDKLNEEETELLEDKKDISDLIEYLEKKEVTKVAEIEGETEENYLKEIYDELGNIGKGFEDLKGEIVQLENNQIVISKNDNLYSRILIGGVFALLGAAGAVAFLGRLK